MSEAIAFLGGLISMAIVWFIYDTKYNPYLRGYAEGLNDGIEEMMKDFSKLRGERMNDWTPCSKRLPDKEGEYIVTDDAGGMTTEGTG